MTGECIDLCHLSVRIVTEFTYTRSEQLSADKRRYSADHMNCAGAGKIVKTDAREPSATPYPVCLDRIYDRRDNSGIDAVGEEFRSLCHRAGDYGRRSCAENKVEYKARKVEIRICSKEVKAGLTDESHKIFSHKQTEAYQYKYHGAYTEVHEVLHYNVSGIFRPREARLYHCKACLHPKYKCRAYQEPNSEYLLGRRLGYKRSYCLVHFFCLLKYDLHRTRRVGGCGISCRAALHCSVRPRMRPACRTLS